MKIDDFFSKLTGRYQRRATVEVQALGA